MHGSIRWLPGAVLCAVVLVQRVLVYGGTLTPWMGAGFSMFTTTDDPFSRHLRCAALAEDGHELFRSAPSDPSVPDAALYHPTDGRLAPIASELARTRCGAPPELAAQVARIQVEVWSLEFRTTDATVLPRRVARVEREVP